MTACTPLKRWITERFLPLSWLDYVAIAAAAAGVIDEVANWLAAQ